VMPGQGITDGTPFQKKPTLLCGALAFFVSGRGTWAELLPSWRQSATWP
jgi:hypothetical protein